MANRKPVQRRRGISLSSLSSKKMNGMLVFDVGIERKALLFNYSAKTRESIKEIVTKLIDKDIHQNPECYKRPQSLREKLETVRTLEEKVIVILRHEQRLLYIKKISSLLQKEDRAYQTTSLRVALKTILEKPLFYKTFRNKNKKSVRTDPEFGLTEWITK